MSADREIANTLSDGINCLAEIASALTGPARESNDPPGPLGPGWPGALEALENALAAVLAGEVSTSLVVHGEDVERIRRVRALVAEWRSEGHAPGELRALADATLTSFGLPPNNAGDKTP